MPRGVEGHAVADRQITAVATVLVMVGAVRRVRGAPYWREMGRRRLPEPGSSSWVAPKLLSHCLSGMMSRPLDQYPQRFRRRPLAPPLPQPTGINTIRLSQAGRQLPRSRASPPKLSHPSCATIRRTRPDSHRAATEGPRALGIPHYGTRSRVQAVARCGPGCPTRRMHVARARGISAPQRSSVRRSRTSVASP